MTGPSPRHAPAEGYSVPSDAVRAILTHTSAPTPVAIPTANAGPRPYPAPPKSQNPTC